MGEDTGFRSVADQLRSWSDDRLARLFAERPDLVTPAPHDFGQLASRVAVRASIVRALDILTRFELFVLDALVVAGQTTAAHLQEIVNADPAMTEPALERLLDLALVWESRSGLRAVSAVAEAMAGGPESGVSGLRPRTTESASPTQLAERLAALSPAARAMLEHVVDHGGQATPGDARLTLSPDQARTPAEELLARRLLVPRTPGVVEAPGEVGLVLRGGTTTVSAVDVLPQIASADRDSALVDRTAGATAFEVVRRTELLLDRWGADPPGELRNGGLSVRDLKTTATALQVEPREAALLVEVAAAAQLLATRADSEGSPVWCPTDAFDTWCGTDVAERWMTLARAWLGSQRMPALVGTRDPQGKTWNALAPTLDSRRQPESRAMTLSAIAGLPEGQVLASGTGPASVLARVAWERPRRPRTREEQVRWAVEEATALGLMALGGVARHARLLLAGEIDKATTLLAEQVPDPVDHVLMQGDLTAVAPGPLEPLLARRLQQLADVESAGGATVYRFSGGSVRRALDLGWTAVELHDFLGAVSTTPVPQGLSYLVDDTVRTFGTIRVGHAEAFLRADDEAALAELMHHPRAAALGLRRLAPTVLISSVPLDVLLPRLREAGAAPVVEAADGTISVQRPEQLRARTPAAASRTRPHESAREAARVSAAVAAVRSGDRAASNRPDTAAATPSGALSALRAAIGEGATVVIRYLDNHGVSSDRVVDPRSVEGGRLTAYDHRSEDLREFAIHRIAAVQPLAPGASP